jgi:hypothetical protein
MSSPVSQIMVDRLWAQHLRARAAQPYICIPRTCEIEDDGRVWQSEPKPFTAPPMIKQRHWYVMVVRDQAQSILGFSYAEARSLNADFAAEVITVSYARMNELTMKQMEDRFLFKGILDADPGGTGTVFRYDNRDYAMHMLALQMGCKSTEIVMERVFKTFLLSKEFRTMREGWLKRLAKMKANHGQQRANEVREKAAVAEAAAKEEAARVARERAAAEAAA